MRVAVCLSGQLRQWEIAKENQKWFWSTSGHEVDYFIHTWSYSGDRAGVTHEYEWRDISKEEYKDICDYYEVKDGIYDTTPQEWFYDNDHWSALFYSLSQSVMLKRKYEIENNFEYDVVIKSRPDIVFNPSKRKTCHLEHDCFDNMLWTTHGGEMGHEFGMFNIDDCVFYSNSYTMDGIVNMYFYRQKLIESRPENKEILCTQQLGPGVQMHEYCREYGIVPQITTKDIKDWRPTLLKMGCPTNLNLFSPKSFRKMEKYFREFYTK